MEPHASRKYPLIQMKLTRSLILPLLSLLLGSTASFPGPSLASELSKDMKKALNELPEKALTLELIVDQAIQHADQFKAILADEQKVASPYLNALAQLDPRFFVKASRGDNQNDMTGFFITDFQKQTEIGFGIMKKFDLGTEFSADVTYRDSASQFTSFSQSGIPSSQLIQFQEAVGTVRVKQSLWKDAFGYATRASVESGEKATLLAAYQLQMELEAGVESLIELYYTAWRLKSSVIAAKANFERQKRLLKITKIKTNRGTAEAPDLYQIQNSWTVF